MSLGRCKPCDVWFVWTGRCALSDAYCSRCGQPLHRTTRPSRRNAEVVRCGAFPMGGTDAAKLRARRGVVESERDRMFAALEKEEETST